MSWKKQFLLKSISLYHNISKPFPKFTWALYKLRPGSATKLNIQEMGVLICTFKKNSADSYNYLSFRATAK